MSKTSSLSFSTEKKFLRKDRKILMVTGVFSIFSRLIKIPQKSAQIKIK